MRVYLLPKNFHGQELLVLKGKDFNYLVNVLRLKEGQKLTGRDSQGHPWDLKLDCIGKDFCVLATETTDSAEITTDALPQDRPTKNLVLYQCLPKGKKAEDIVKKATEIGARAIVFVKSKNCIADFSGKEESKINRYESIVKEAFQQSGSLVPTTVEGVIDIKDVPAHFAQLCKQLGQEGRGIFLHQCKVRAKQGSLYETVKQFSGTIGILVGPEGGLSDSECDALIQGQFKPVLLKTNILRCETASIYALAAVQTIVETGC